MGKVSVLAAAAIAGGLLCSATPSLAQVTVGTPGLYSSNCNPFSCSVTYPLSEYQQDYNSAAFPSGQTTSFNQISFNAAPGYAGHAIDQATYTISFYLTSNTMTLSTDLGSNESTFLGNFGTFALGGTLPATLTLLGQTINYDPSLGNLLMDVTVSGTSAATGPLGYFAGELNGGNVSSAFSGYRGTIADGAGLVTTFSAVPEPATWAMMLLGFGAIGMAMRNRRRQAALA